MRFIRIASVVALSLLVAIAISLVIRPELRAALLAEIYDPVTLPQLESDARIHHEPQARICAERVAAILPGAVERIARAHGRPFAKAPIVGVYDSFATYARANGLGAPGIAGVSRAGRAILSPTLCHDERERLEGVLTHELSHVHFSGWRARNAPRPPTWFTEGLAVMVSEGGGAEGVSDADAAQAIRDGYAVILDGRSWLDFAALGFEKAPVTPSGFDAYSWRQRLAFRQASVFLSWLREKDPARFSALLRDLERGETFDGAFRAAFGAAPAERWRDFTAGLHASR
ncbi:MAG: hypothetical protein CTY15_01860 [Methylocystis sp.]|nr:MAG: hypothetical protein CTY15_01860 [Methylocystis sp.]